MKRYIRKYSSENLLRSKEIRLRSGERKEIGKHTDDQIIKTDQAA